MSSSIDNSSDSSSSNLSSIVPISFSDSNKEWGYMPEPSLENVSIPSTLNVNAAEFVPVSFMSTSSSTTSTTVSKVVPPTPILNINASPFDILQVFKANLLQEISLVRSQHSNMNAVSQEEAVFAMLVDKAFELYSQRPKGKKINENFLSYALVCVKWVMVVVVLSFIAGNLKSLDPKWSMTKWARATNYQTYGTDVIGQPGPNGRVCLGYGQDLYIILRSFVQKLKVSIRNKTLVPDKNGNGIDPETLNLWLNNHLQILTELGQTARSFRKLFFDESECVYLSKL